MTHPRPQIIHHMAQHQRQHRPFMLNRTFSPFFLLPERVMSLKDYNGPLMNSNSHASTLTLHYRFLTLDLPVE